MITPQEIRKKAERLYPDLVRAWLQNEDDFFPVTLRSSKSLSKDAADNIRPITDLRNGSKEIRGFGYSVRWERKRLRNAGHNDVPVEILFETQSDVLKLLNRETEFAALSVAVAKIRAELPQLESWIQSRFKTLTSVANEVDGLIAVTKWWQQNPLPNCFARQIPVDVDTKFVERHRKILRQWFDVADVLPPHAIRSDESDFFRRYGLLDKELQIFVRFLDNDIRQQLGFPCEEAALPLSTLAGLNVETARIFILENKTSVRTFPTVSRGIAIFGQGYAATLLRHVKWLHSNEVVYSGDIDVDGMAILAQFRGSIPATRSLLMEHDTLVRFHQLCGKGNGKNPEPPALLTDEERKAFEICAAENCRLEQEQIPQAAVEAAVNERFWPISQ